MSVPTVVCQCHNPGAFWHGLLLRRVDLEIPCFLHEADDHCRIKSPPAQEILLNPVVALADGTSFTDALPLLMKRGCTLWKDSILSPCNL